MRVRDTDASDTVGCSPGSSYPTRTTDTHSVGTLRASFRRARTSACGWDARGLIPRGGGVIVCALLACTGCSNARFLSRTCPQPPDPATAAATPSPDVRYRVGCPDVLEVAFADHPEWDVYVSVDLDGRLPLVYPGPTRAEGLTLDEIRDDLAHQAGAARDRVRVNLASARSHEVYVHGPLRGRTRVVPYQGPEPVIDFLKRVGGLPPGSRLNQVYIVRPNVTECRPPEVFRVNVPAVLLDNDQGTNFPLQPSDQVYVGETRCSTFARNLPTWLSTAYRRITGLLPDDWWPFGHQP